MLSREHKFIESIDTFRITLGGDNTIEAEVYTKIINGVIGLIKESSNLYNPDGFIRLDIRCHKEGSFETIIDTVAKYVPHLFNPNMVKLASDVINCFITFLKIKRHLGGEKIRKKEEYSDSVELTNSKGEVRQYNRKIVNAYLNNSNIDNSIINITQNIYEARRDSLQIKKENNEVIFNKECLSSMGMRDPNIKDENIISEETSHGTVELLLKKPDLLGDSKWEFILDKTIKVTIKDEEFLEKVHSKKIKQLYCGVKIKCILEIKIEMGKKYEVIRGSEKYTITKVLEIIEPEESNG